MAFFNPKDKERGTNTGGGAPKEYPLGTTLAVLTGIVSLGTKKSPFDPNGIEEITELWLRYEPARE
jgi:hypothetical protein